MNIVTIGSEKEHCLFTKAESIKPTEFVQAQFIAQQLIDALLALKKPVAGLAANQLGFLQAVFVFSWDRSPEHLEIVINPEYEGLGQTLVPGWEACLSTLNVRKVANIERFETIRVRYTNGTGEQVLAELSGFASRVFQHEYDHLQGILNIHRKGADIKEFESDAALHAFMAEVRSKDTACYIKPKMGTEFFQ